jgi:hypothetical protein
MAIKRLQLRRDTAANWTSVNPVLLAGEPGVETDTGKFKVGDGSTAWASLAYSSGPAGPTGATGATGSTGAAGTNGTNGQGVPTAGTTGQILKKNSGTNYDTTWVDQSTIVAGDTSKVNGKTVYIQTTDPGAVGAGVIWIQTV